MNKNNILRRLRTISPLFPLLFVGLYLLLIPVLLHEKYPDEFDNMLGGKYLLEGIPIYSGFFTHHGPVAYFLAAIIEIFSRHSFVAFRLVYGLFLSAFLTGTLFWFKKRFLEFPIKLYIGFLSLFIISSIYFWGYMFLADSMSAIYLTPVFIYFVFIFFYRIPFKLSDCVPISILTFLSLFSSLTYTYLVFIIYVFTLFAYLRDFRKTIRVKDIRYALIAFLIPYLLFLGYLIITRSLNDYIYQAIIFNQKYYIYNYPRPEDGSINPIRFIIVIFNDFYNAFYGLVIQVFNFNFQYPFNVSLAIVDTAFLLYVLLKRRFTLFFFTLLFMIYANGRSNPLTSRETDYQSSVYIVMSLFLSLYLPWKIYTESHADSVKPKNILFSALLLLVTIYTFFNSFFLFTKYWTKAYDKFMGKAPLIYDTPQFAPMLNAVLTKDDTVMIGPFDFEELFYTNAKPASSEHILIPAMGKSERLQQDLLHDLDTNKPPIIIFDKNYRILTSVPVDYGKFYLSYLTQNYTILADITDGPYKYEVVKRGELHYNLDTNTFLLNTRKDEMLQKLIDKGYIRKVLK